MAPVLTLPGLAAALPRAQHASARFFTPHLRPRPSSSWSQLAAHARRSIVPAPPAAPCARHAPLAAPSAMRPAAPATSPRLSAASPFAALRRAFHTSRPAAIRQTYFPRSGGGGGGRGRGSWWSNFRDRVDAIPTMTVIYGLIGVNVGVFLLWQYGISSFQRFRDPSTYYFLTRHFVLNEANIMAGRIWTLVTSSFSHSSGSHILMNCIGLYFIAPAAASLLGSASFLALYLGGGVFASLTSLAYHRFRRDRWAGSEGASGAIYATLAFYGALFPNTQFLVFFVVPMPAWLFIGGIFAWDLFSAFGRPNSGVDSAGHVGGIIAGVAAAALLRRGRFPGFRGYRRW